MKKLILAGVAASAMFAGVAHANSYGSAVEIRNSLHDVYSGLGGDFNSFTNTTDSFARLLYKIDNLGDIGEVTPFGISLGDDGHLVLEDSTGSIDRGYTIDEVVAEAGTFVSSVNADLFDGNGVPTVYQSVDGATGLATVRLNNIIAEVNRVNAIITDPNTSNDVVDQTRAEFRTYFTRESAGFNNAVDALTQLEAISYDDVNNYTVGAERNGRIADADIVTAEVANITDGVDNFATYGDFVTRTALVDGTMHNVWGQSVILPDHAEFHTAPTATTVQAFAQFTLIVQPEGGAQEARSVGVRADGATFYAVGGSISSQTFSTLQEAIDYASAI